ncbi:unnamed protein product [Hydatigera taeniaeformis]|uniref:RRM domain-containing protein n=1 Tax=Hydatigena taeniaeformis TaxID=6205 RepID=A0A0R3WLX5_HYDTA|nr:unnamed protein product [Hydatigera taeniaeformis]
MEQERQTKANDECEKEKSNDEVENVKESHSSMACGICRRTIGTELIDICHHCRKNMCPWCREHHHENASLSTLNLPSLYRLIVRMKMNDLHRQTSTLKLWSDRLRELKTSLATEEKAMKEKLMLALDSAIHDLQMSARKCLEAAVTKVDKVHGPSTKILNTLKQNISDLVDEVEKSCTIFESQMGITELVEKKKQLESVIVNVSTIGKKLEDLPLLLVAELNLSGLLSKIKEHMNRFSLIIDDEVAPLEQLTISEHSSSKTSQVKLFVGRLHPCHTESQLHQHFSRYGTVAACRIVRDRVTNESKCFGFVTFRKATDADRALSTGLHFIEDSHVIVEPYEIKPKKKSKKTEEKEVETGKRRRRRKKEQNAAAFTSEKIPTASCGKKTSHQLVVQNLPLQASKRSIHDLLDCFGRITKLKIIQKERKAFVSFSTEKELQAALRAAPHCFKNNILPVSTNG